MLSTGGERGLLGLAFHSDGACSVTEGSVYRGTLNRRLTGTYLFADFCNGKISGATRDANGVITTQLLLDAPFLIATFGEDAGGEVYVADFSNGVLYRIDDARQPASRRRAVRH